MDNPFSLQASNITFDYSGRQILHDLSLRITTGQIVGLLGPNGAGKSTTLQILGGVLPPSSGEVRIAGQRLSHQPDLIRRIGYLPATPPLYNDLTALEQLQFAACLFLLPPRRQRTRIEFVMEACQLDEVARQRIGQLSKGFRQRLGLAQALLHEPEILLLDEPTDGLDPLQVSTFQTLLKSLQPATAILLSTHNLSEVKTLCSDVLIINKGQLVYRGAMAEIDEPLEQCFTRLIYSGESLA
jgi:ABC-2 type transport system ATP-binding protein